MALDEPYVSAIKKFEGFTPKAKWDYKQWSGGYGTRAQPGQVFDEKQADGMLRGELGQARDLVRKFRPDLQPGQEAALTSLTFNAGNKWMNSGLGQAVKAGDWNTASQRLQQYTRAGGEVLPGLVKRRQQEAQWLTGGGMLDPSGAAPPMGLGGPAQGAAVPPAANGTWTPDEVNARRRMASGMIQEGMSSAPVQHWTQGVARVLGGLSGNMWMEQANKAQRDGMAASAQTMQDALAGGDPKAAIGGMLANPWTQDQGQKLATGMLANEIQSQTPDAKLAREAKQFALDNSRENAPLERQMKEEQIAKLQRDAANGDNPAAVREWQFFSRLDPAAQERYLTMKRSDKYLDTGTAFVRPSQVDPTARPVASVPKNVAEEARLKKVGAETGELQAGAPKAEASLRAADAKADIVLNTIAEAKQKVGLLTTGFSGSILSNIPGSDARDLRAKLDTLKANAGFAELQAMRDNSPTGGALGQVAVQELAMLQATITSLEQAQTPAQLSKALDDFEKFVRESKVRRKQAYDATYGAVRQPQPGAGGGTPAQVPSGNYVFDPATGQLRPR